MNFGNMMKKYAYKHGLEEDLTDDRLRPFVEEETGKAAVITEARRLKATTRFDQLREMMQKRWKLVEVPTKKKKAKKK